ncbi:ATP-NAD kinase family protein [Kangiella sediminilitoris]|uniref:ATP-NAD kinase n=1 Tax=Kangiella sediminilitoris TaxID=1144748 RepID=A0A1B3B9W2_9GAMM|nr:ATP-NAD kinase family protein [Kangiella sediminilitoris]AOE49548.1 ATP-NAD kinase [Kangiella sediminilitoris]
MFNLGFIINPFAGIGGKVGLKGSDGQDIRAEAFARGAKPQAVERARVALKPLVPYREHIHMLTASGDMGENLLRDMGFSFEVVHQSEAPSSSDDTIRAAQIMTGLADNEKQIEVLMFAGGDGTARNIFEAVDGMVPVLGIPAGVKIHSGVYAVTPHAAGLVIEKMINQELVSLLETSVMDIDEEAFRKGVVRAKQYGEMQVPAEHRYVQATKSGGKEVEELVLQDIADYIIENMEDDYYYLIGSGSTCAFVMESLGLENTLLGIDCVHQGAVIESDMTESDILKLLKEHPKRVKVIITVIGGQGHIIGRGNQQLSSEVLSFLTKDDITIIATKTKLKELEGRPLIVDSDNPRVNQHFAGVIKVITGYQDFVLYPVGIEQ